MRSIDLEEEKRFENSKILSDEVRSAQRKYYWANQLSISQHRKLSYAAINGLSGLEIGCSSGADAVEYSNYCRNYVGIDISDEAIKAAQDRRLSNCEFICTDGHTLPCDSESMDFVIVNSLLHHLDLEITFPEISRVLKNGGRLIFREPMGTNPLFQAYRLLTPSARTKDERPFTFSDIRLMKKYFEFKELHWSGFMCVGAAFLRREWFRKFLHELDLLISRTPLKFLFWQISGVAVKRQLETELN